MDVNRNPQDNCVKATTSAKFAPYNTTICEKDKIAEITFVITKRIACLSETKEGWTKELNMVSWNSKEPKYDIRVWSSDHTVMQKSIALSPEELAALKVVFSELT